MWRPNDWKNPYHKFILRPSINIQEVIGQYCESSYEAGADAYGKALKEEGKYTEGKSPTLSISVLPGQKGWLVFIPDEESK